MHLLRQVHCLIAFNSGSLSPHLLKHHSSSLMAKEGFCSRSQTKAGWKGHRCSWRKPEWVAATSLVIAAPCWATDNLLTSATTDPTVSPLVGVGLALGGVLLGGSLSASQSERVEEPPLVSPRSLVEVSPLADALAVAETRADRLAGQVSALERDLQSALIAKERGDAALQQVEKVASEREQAASSSLENAKTEIRALRYELRVTVEEAERVDAELAAALPLALESEEAKAAMGVANRRAKEAELRAELAIQEAEAKAAEEAAGWVKQAKAAAKKEYGSEVARRLGHAKVERALAVQEAKREAQKEALKEMEKVVEAAKAAAVAEAMRATGGGGGTAGVFGDRRSRKSAVSGITTKSVRGGSGGRDEVGVEVVYDNDDDDNNDEDKEEDVEEEKVGRGVSGVWGDGSESSREALAATTQKLDSLLEDLRDKDRDLRLTGHLSGPAGSLGPNILIDLEDSANDDDHDDDADDDDDHGHHDDGDVDSESGVGKEGAGVSIDRRSKHRNNKKRGGRRSRADLAALEALEEASFEGLAESTLFKLEVEDDALRSGGTKGLKAKKLKVADLRSYLVARGLPTEDEAGRKYTKTDLLDIVVDFLGLS